MTSAVKRLHELKSSLYRSYTYRFIDSWIIYDESNSIHSQKKLKNQKRSLPIVLIRAIDLVCWSLLSMVFIFLYLFFNSIFAILHRIIFKNSFHSNSGRLFEYIEQFSESPGVGFMKALEGNLFSKQEIISPSLEIGIETGVVSSLHFKGKVIDVGSEYALEHLQESKDMTIWEYKLCFDIRKIPFKDNTLNTILAVHVMDHFGELNETFKEINRVLKPKGRFIFSLFSYHYLLASPISLILSMLGLKRLAERNGRMRATQRGVFNFYENTEWQNMLAEYKMNIVQAQYFLNGYISHFWYFIRYYLGRRWGMSGIPNLIGVRYRSFKFPGVRFVRFIFSSYLKKIGYWLYQPFYKKEIDNPMDKGLNIFLVAEKQ